MKAESWVKLLRLPSQGGPLETCELTCDQKSGLRCGDKKRVILADNNMLIRTDCHTKGANMQGRFCPTMQKKMAEDVGKRMKSLDERIRAGQVSKDVMGQLVSYCQALERNDVNSASSIQTALTASHWDEHRQWLVSSSHGLVTDGLTLCRLSRSQQALKWIQDHAKKSMQ